MKKKLEELIEAKIKNKINDCNKKIEELKISNEVHDKNLQGNMVLSNKSINDLEKKMIKILKIVLIKNYKILFLVK